MKILDDVVFDDKIKKTVGYVETKNKKDFEMGASVAKIIISKSIEEELESIQTSLKMYKSLYEQTLNDIKKLKDVCKILDKYDY